MLKLTIGLKEVDNTMNINLIDPTTKQLESATENEKILAQQIKEVLDKKLLELLEDHTSDKKEN